jgi:hypothetical protein
MIAPAAADDIGLAGWRGRSPDEVGAIMHRTGG